MFLPLMIMSLSSCSANSFSSSSFYSTGLSAPVTVEVAVAYRVRHAVIFSCCDHCVMTILRALSDIGIPGSVINPNQPESTKLLTTKTLLNWINILLIGDLECEGMTLLLENLPDELFSPPYHWLVFTSSQSWGERLTQPFQKIRFDSDFILCIYDNHSVLDLKELYSMNVNQTKVLVVGSWTVGAMRIHNFIPKRYKFSYRRRGNVKGGTIRAIVSVSISENKLFVDLYALGYLEEFSNSSSTILGSAQILMQTLYPLTVSFHHERMSLSYKSTSLFKRTGFGPHDINTRVFLHIRDLFNFSIEERIIEGISSDAEIFHALKKGTSDVTVIVMGMIPQRSPDIAYLHAISRLRVTITFLQPQVTSLQNVFILPFSRDVWILLAVLVVLVFAFLTLDISVILGDKLWTISDLFLITIAIVCQKGIAKYPQIYSACIVMFFFSIVTALLYSAYAGQIVSLLSIQEPLIKSVKDLSDYKFKLGVDAYPYLKMYFTDSTDLSVQQLGRDHLTVLFPNAAEFVRKPHNCYSTSDYQADILKSAFHDEELCKLIIFNVHQAEAPLAMAVESQSQYKEMLNWGTLKIMEQGLYSRYKNETEKKITSQCSNAPHSVELLGLLFVFYLLIGGMVSASVLLLLEIIIWKLAESAKLKNKHQMVFIN